MADNKSAKPRVDWEAVELEYRAGIRSLADIGSEFCVSAPGILKRAKKDGWVRDLSAKIKAKADAKVNESLVNDLVNAKTAVSERQTIESNAQMLADIVLNQRTNVKRAMTVVVALWGEIEAAGDYTEEFRRVGELMRSEDEFGQDRLNDMYVAAIGMPQRVKNVKLLADALKVLIELQRKILKLDDDKTAGDGSGAFISLNDAQRASRIAFLIEKARGNG